MKKLKNFESWKNGMIDDTLFSSGRAKYEPQVKGNKIKYTTDEESDGKYYARITQKGNEYICKIYKKRLEGKDIRIKKKIKDDLKDAHNYVREFLNQKIKKDKEKGKTSKEKKSKDEYDEMDILDNEPNDMDDDEVSNNYETPPTDEYIPPVKKIRIRRF